MAARRWLGDVIDTDLEFPVALDAVRFARESRVALGTYLRIEILGVLILIENSLRVEACNAEFIATRRDERRDAQKDESDSFHSERVSTPNN